MTIEAKFVCALGEGALAFRRMVGEEQLGRMPEYRIELLRKRTEAPIAASELLGKTVSVKFLVAEDTWRFVNGIVVRMERGGTFGRFDLYRIELRPWLWHLTLGADCRVYQDKTAVEIIEAIFAEYSSAGSVDKKLIGSFRTRPFTVQYGESDFNFVSRLMEEEGIYYYFKHSDGQHTLVLCNGATGHDPIDAGDLHWRQEVGENHDDNLITQWSLAHTLGSLKYTHTDYAPEAPTTDLKGEAERETEYTSTNPNNLEVFEYPGGYDDLAMVDGKTADKQAEATRLAQIQVDAFESRHVRAIGLSPNRYLAAGCKFTFADHPDAAEYLLSMVDFELEFGGYESDSGGSSSGFSCRFEAVPASIRYVPRRSAVRPTIHGPQTAKVVGPSGDEIHTDKYGRVRLQFRWDREAAGDETSSCWVRVSHPWASKQFGMIALPRIGDEVVVEFLEGNPDRPLITGRVYNFDNMPPYELPAQATVSGIKTQSSTGGSLSTFNELRFDDKKDSEYVWFQAEKDFHQLVKHDAFETIQNDLWTDVTMNSTHKVGENLTLSVGKVATVKVIEDTHVNLGADLNMAVTGLLNLKVTDKVAVQGEAAIEITSGAAMEISVGAALNITASSTLHIKGSGIVIDGGTELCIKAGGSFITLDSGGVTIQGSQVKINCGGSAGSATAAAEASPAAPTDPVESTENEDPLAAE